MNSQTPSEARISTLSGWCQLQLLVSAAQSSHPPCHHNRYTRGRFWSGLQIRAPHCTSLQDQLLLALPFRQGRLQHAMLESCDLMWMPDSTQPGNNQHHSAQ